jgi:hypothetical protein
MWLTECTKSAKMRVGKRNWKFRIFNVFWNFKKFAKMPKTVKNQQRFQIQKIYDR